MRLERVTKKSRRGDLGRMQRVKEGREREEKCVEQTRESTSREDNRETRCERTSEEPPHRLPRLSLHTTSTRNPTRNTTAPHATLLRRARWTGGSASRTRGCKSACARKTRRRKWW
ncbi:hypothetical protein DENSPDRAFT_227208 [Dentipellis sp. KUC8613]|nr:hypothetical protein DENSPDRAFT_227208 [Dentipellis sp. KUC8613]